MNDIAIKVYRTEASLLPAAEALVHIGYSVSVELELSHSHVDARLGLRILGQSLPDALAIRRGDALVLGLRSDGVVVAVAVVPPALLGPLEQAAVLVSA